MVKKSQFKPSAGRSPKNQRRERVSFAQALSSANRRAHEQANRKGGRRSRKYAWTADAVAGLEDGEDEIESAEWFTRLMRWGLASLLLPLCWVTTWTLLSRFFQVTVDQALWKSAEFWYF